MLFTINKYRIGIDCSGDQLFYGKDCVHYEHDIEIIGQFERATNL